MLCIFAGMSQPFTFRQFTIRQDKAAFKVGTDSVLLGAWTDVSHAHLVLDIGTGTGILALMTAQRSNAFIRAVEIDPVSAQQAAENFARSPWSERIACLPLSLEDFAKTKPEKYDLIVSNPPYFQNSLLPGDRRKENARHTSQLSFRSLAESVSQLLTNAGQFSFILPVEGFEQLQFMLEQKEIFPYRICDVKSFADASVIRRMGRFGKSEKEILRESVFLYEREGHRRSQIYSELTKDFYL